MPSPIAHAGMGYVIHRLFRKQKDHSKPILTRKLIVPTVATIGLSMLPDLDIIPGVLVGSFGRFHNMFTNSFTLGIAAAVGVGSIVWAFQRSGFKRWFLIALMSYYLHVAMDFLTIGRGPMLLWPFTDERFQPPFKAFYGAHWSEGWVSSSHIWTILSELAFVGVLLVLVKVLSLSKKPSDTPIESQRS